MGLMHPDEVEAKFLTALRDHFAMTALAAITPSFDDPWWPQQYAKGTARDVHAALAQHAYRISSAMMLERGRWQHSEPIAAPQAVDPPEVPGPSDQGRSR